MKKWRKICFVISIFVIGSVFYLIMNSNTRSTENFVFAPGTSITIITLTNNNALLGGAEYSITPDPFKNIWYEFSVCYRNKPVRILN